MLFKLSNLNSNLALTVGYLNPALNNSAQEFIYFRPINLRWGGGCLFNLENTMVSVLHKEVEYKVEKLKYKMVGGHAAEDQNQIPTSTW